MPDWLATIVGAAVGAGLAVLGSFIVSVILEKRRRKREVGEFYSWVASLLERLDRGHMADVTTELTAQTLHYTFNRLWGQIPRKVEVDGRGLHIRDLMLNFIKSGDNLNAIKDDQSYYDLRRWLEDRSA